MNDFVSAVNAIGCANDKKLSLKARSCNKSCWELSGTASVCENENFPGCDCDPHLLDNGKGVCVSKSDCTCVDRYHPKQKIHDAGQTIARGCTTW